MNNTFSIQRFGWLLKKTLLERPVQLSGLVGLILLTDVILYTICRFINMELEVIQNLTFIFGLVGGGCFLASFVFNYFSSNAAGTSYLTLPASTPEKWLCGVLITGILYTFIFLSFFSALDTFYVWQIRNSLDPQMPHYKDIYDNIKPFRYDGFVATKVYVMFLNFAGAMLIGSLYFNKGSFIKVALVACGLYIGGHVLNQLIALAVFDKIDKALPYYSVFIPVGNEFGKVLLPDYASKAVDICLLFIVPGILWVTTLVRLREKEF